MARWRYTLDLVDVWKNDDLTLEQRRDEIVQRIRSALFWDEYDDDLVLLVDELSEVGDDGYFDHVWNAFYDWADDNDVWVATFWPYG